MTIRVPPRPFVECCTIPRSVRIVVTIKRRKPHAIMTRHTITYKDKINAQ